MVGYEGSLIGFKPNRNTHRWGIGEAQWSDGESIVKVFRQAKKWGIRKNVPPKKWCAREDLNPRHTDPKSDALSGLSYWRTQDY